MRFAATAKERKIDMAVKAYLEVTMQIPAENRKAAAKVYSDYRKSFLETIPVTPSIK